MSRFLLIIGLLLILLPIPACGLEIVLAKLAHATGAKAAPAGFWAMMVGFISVPAGFVSLILGAIVWGLQR